MKLYHLILIFTIIAITIVLTTDIKTNSFKTVINNKEQIDRKLDAAIDDGVNRLVQVDSNNDLIINKDASMESFFMSLHSSFGLLNDKDNGEKLNLYIPVVAVTMVDGYYIFYSDEYTGTDGHKYISKRWSEKYPYVYEDEDFIYGFTLGSTVTLYDKNKLINPSGSQAVFQSDYNDIQTSDEYAAFRSDRPDSFLLSGASFEQVRKAAIIKCLEGSMAYYTSRHNRIAAQYGITYNFNLPVISDEEWMSYLDDVSVFVVFQGYPYGDEQGETYNRVTSAGAKVSKDRVYYIEQKEWYLVYHKSTCKELKKGGIVFNEEPYYSIEDCAKQGAYACEICSPDQGVYAPDYKP